MLVPDCGLVEGEVVLGSHGRSITRRVSAPLVHLLAGVGITPDQMAVTGALLSVGTVVSTLPFGYVWQEALALTLALFAGSVGGTLARMTNGGIRFGVFLNSTLDRIAGGAAFASLTAWAVFSSPEGLPRTLTVGFGLTAIIGVGTVPYAKARTESIGVEVKLGVVEGTDRLPIVILSAVFTDFGWGAWWLVIGLGWAAFAPFITITQRIIFTAKTVKEETQV